MLYQKTGPDDLVICDTITSLANTTITDMKLGNDPTQPLWGKHRIYFGDPNFMTVYLAAMQTIIRKLKNVCRGGDGARIIVTAHEKEQKDDTGEILGASKRAPDVSPAMLGALKGASSDMFRLRQQTDAEVDAEGRITLPAGSYVLTLRGGDDAMTKFHVAPDKSDKLPRRMKVELSDPALPKLYRILGKKPTWLVLYGPPGAGKTTFCASEAFAQLASLPPPESTITAKEKVKKNTNG